jgi:hypothetical protein
MNNSIDQWKKEMDEITIPNSKLNKTIHSAFQRGKKEKRGSWGKKIISITSAAAIVCGVTLGSAYYSPTAANALSNIPFIGSIFEMVGDSGLKDVHELGLATEVNQTVSNQGISFTVKDVIYDGSRLSIGYLQESKHGIEEITGGIELYVDGEPLNAGGGMAGQHIDENQYAGTYSVVPNKALPKSFDLEMKIYQVGEQRGEWFFEFPVTKVDGVKTLMPMETAEHNNTSVTVKQAILSPSGTKLLIETKNEQMLDRDFPYFQLSTDKGEVLKSLSFSGGGDKNIMNYEALYEPLNTPAEFLELQLFRYPKVQLDDHVTETLNQPYPIKLDQGAIGEMVIDKVEFLKGRTVVHYHVNGDFPYVQYDIQLLNGNGEFVETIEYSERVDKEGYYFVQSFKPVKKEAASIRTFQMEYPKIYEELKVKFSLE